VDLNVDRSSFHSHLLLDFPLHIGNREEREASHHLRQPSLGEQGYVVTKVFRVLEYDSADDQLFAPYISEFMAAKIHSSGFDSCMKGNFEKEEKFIKECKEKFGIHIERSKMGPNKGKRTQAKLMLNNLWGRFSLRNFGLSQCAITDNPAELHKFYNDKSIEITGLDELTEEILLITYIKKKRLDRRAQLLQRGHLFVDNVGSTPPFASCHAESCAIIWLQTFVHRHRLTDFCSSNQQLSSITWTTFWEI
uniref:DNA-directed DNA polymerase n=1 Tax=Meloidogyne incognita TaxID=6306 RepID=A0A914P3L0_MELIC